MLLDLIKFVQHLFVLVERGLGKLIENILLCCAEKLIFMKIHFGCEAKKVSESEPQERTC